MTEFLEKRFEMPENTQTSLEEAEKILQQVIYQEQELSAEQGQIVSLGALRGDTPPEHWTGTISLAKRLESSELTQTEVDLQHERLKYFFRDSRSVSPKRCGDGRTVAGYDSTSVEWHEQGLGVQIFGGTGGDATGIRLSKGFETGATFATDVEVTAKEHESDFAPGDHTDDHAEGENTGCGAVDGQARKNEIHINSERSASLRSILEFVYEKANLNLLPEFFGRLKRNSQSINEHSAEYFADKHHALSAIKEQNPNGIEPLVGAHKETSLTLNFVAGTTFDRDRYSAESDGKIQNFNVDVWSIIKEHGDNASFVLADQIATALDLTDGTIEVFARVSK